MKPTALLLIHALIAPSPAPLAPPRHPTVKLSFADLALAVGEVGKIGGVVRFGSSPFTVTLQADRQGRGWVPVSRSTTTARGRFLLRFAAPVAGRWPLRLEVKPAGLTTSPPARCAGLCAASLPHRRPERLFARLGVLEVFRPAVASWYGGGGPLACGGYLTPATLGVANRFLPCGTPVTFRYGRHTITVPVIDRGPFVEGREFDLTEATKNALGFSGLGVVWTTAP